MSRARARRLKPKTFPQSVSDHLAKYYAPENHVDVSELTSCLSCILKFPTSQKDLTGAYINEHGRLLVVGIFNTYVLDMEDYAWGIVPLNFFWNESITKPRNVGRLPYISVELPRVDLIWVYYAIYRYVGKKHLRMPYQQGQHYVPGSILTVRGQTLVGGVRDRSRLCEWNVCWSGPHCSSENPYNFVVIGLLSTDWFVACLTFGFLANCGLSVDQLLLTLLFIGRMNFI